MTHSIRIVAIVIAALGFCYLAALSLHNQNPAGCTQWIKVDETTKLHAFMAFSLSRHAPHAIAYTLPLTTKKRWRDPISPEFLELLANRGKLLE
jgi:hypothetical protein